MDSPKSDLPKNRHKRRRDPSSSSSRSTNTTSDMATSNFPPLPLITGDLVLETFSHSSLGLCYDPDMSTDNQRLIELGRIMLDFAATQYLYSKRPIVAAAEIPALRNNILSAEKCASWVSYYSLLPRLRYVHSESLDVTSPEETKYLFQAYVGAVVVQSGLHIATNWVSQLIDPEAPLIISLDEQQEAELEEHRVSKRPRVQPSPPEATPPALPAEPPPAVTPAPVNDSLNPTNHSAAQLTNTAPTVTPAIGPKVVPNVMTSAPKGPGYLLFFNQRCAQARLKVDYQATNYGSAHAPLWVMKCLVNGIQKSEGRGASKQVAKEDAAKQAYYAMGWTAQHGLPS